MEPGRVQPVVRLGKSPAVRRSCKRGHAVPLLEGLKPDRPGAVVQIDTLLIKLAPGKPIEHFTASAFPQAGEPGRGLTTTPGPLSPRRGPGPSDDRYRAVVMSDRIERARWLVRTSRPADPRSSVQAGRIHE